MPLQVGAGKNSNKLKFIGLYLDHRFEHDETSPYQILLRKLSTGYELEVGVYPIKRSTQSLVRDKTACGGPSSIEAIKKFYSKELKGNKIIESDKIELLTTRLFSRVGSPVARNIKDIEGKNIVSWLGIPDKLFLPNVEFNSIKVKSDNQALKVLNAGRADYVLGWIPDTPLVAESMGFEQPLFDQSLAIFSGYLSIVCHDTDRNRKYLKNVNKRLAELKKSGELQKILGPYSVIAK